MPALSIRPFKRYLRTSSAPGISVFNPTTLRIIQTRLAEAPAPPLPPPRYVNAFDDLGCTLQQDDPRQPMRQRLSAGVLVPLCVDMDGNASILYTVRSWAVSGRHQVSFPGGMRDDEDMNIFETARREAGEECGLKDIHILGKMKQYWAVSKRYIAAVTPVVGFIGEIDADKVKRQSGEVGDVFTLTLDELRTPSNHIYRYSQPMSAYYGSIAGQTPVPTFYVANRRPPVPAVWGLTADVTNSLIGEILDPPLDD